MYCRHCGAEMNSDAPVCPSCGVSAGSGSTYCANCGAECQPGAVFCSHCGCQFAPEQAQQTYYQDPSQQAYQNQAYPGADPSYQASGQGYRPPGLSACRHSAKIQNGSGSVGHFPRCFRRT